jgi:hypothetical protein
MVNEPEMKPKAPAKEWDSESRVRENRLHGLLRGGFQTVIGLCAFQPVASRLLYSATPHVIQIPRTRNVTPVLNSLRDSFVADAWHPGAFYRYGMLLVTVGLLLWHGWWLFTLPPAYPYDRYGGAVVGLMLLLNQLAFAFRWSRTTTIAFRISAWLWLVFGLAYLCYLSDVWFPTR